jgi:TolB-like protein
MVWIVRCAYRAYKGFPRILRWVVIIWFITFLFSRNDDSDDSNRNARGPDDPTPTSEESAEGDDIKTGLLETAQELRNVEGFGEFGRIIGAVADAAQAGRPLVLTPFVYNSTEATNEEFTKRVFNQLLRSIRVTRADEVAVSPSALGVAPTSADILARISRTESRFLLTGWVEIEAADNSAHFELVLHSTDSPSLIWTQRYPVANTDAASIVDDILAALSTHDVFAPAAPPEDPEIPETLPEAVP